MLRASDLQSQDILLQKLESLRLEVKQEVGEVKQEVGEIKQDVGVVKQVQELQGDVLPMLAKQIYGFRAATHSTFDPEFESKCKEYYQTASCMILGQLLPVCLRDVGEEYYFGSDYFLPVGEHIYKKSMEKEGKDVGIVTRHPRNGLLLVKALESQFQDGHMVLIPVEAAGEQLHSDAGTLGEVQEPQTRSRYKSTLPDFCMINLSFGRTRRRNRWNRFLLKDPSFRSRRGRARKKEESLADAAHYVW